MRIRAEQLKTLELASAKRFEDEMIEHAREFSPRLCRVLNEAELRFAVRAAIARAGTHGFTNRGPIRLFLEFSFLFGSSFDTDPQCWRISAALEPKTDQMLRATQLHQLQLDYLNAVSGPGNSNVHKALEDLLFYARVPGRFSQSEPAQAVLREMMLIFPKKVEYTGDEAMNALARQGVQLARKHQFTAVRHQILLIVLMFAFGHGCTTDPLYPWIARTLTDDRIVSPDARAERLEKKALTWLEHVIEANKEERPA